MLHKFLPLFLSLLILFPIPAFADSAAPAPQEPDASESVPFEDDYTSYDASDTEPLETQPEAPTETEAPAETQAPASDPEPTFESQYSNDPPQTPTDPSTEPTEVIEVVENDYTGMLTSILQEVQGFAYTSQLIAGFLLFFVVVTLCYFSYKFFKIFF